MGLKLDFNFSTEQLAELMITAIESGDPVTTAVRGGWCSAINWHGPGPRPRGNWYAEPKTYEGDFVLEVIEVDDETTGHETKHLITMPKIEKGLAAMAKKYPHVFADIINDNMDAATADLFLQCVVFGEEKYA
jgi:hypothetical protein